MAHTARAAAGPTNDGPTKENAVEAEKGDLWSDRTYPGSVCDAIPDVTEMCGPSDPYALRIGDGGTTTSTSPVDTS
jgi:hypothetical protein